MLRCEHSLAGRSALTGHHNPGRNLPWVAAIWHFWLVFAPQGGHSEPEIFASYFFAVLLDLRGFLPGLAVVAPVPTMAKSSRLLPPFIAAVSHRGLRPRPAQVSFGLSGLRYLGATTPERHRGQLTSPDLFHRGSDRALKAPIQVLDAAPIPWKKASPLPGL